MNRFFCVSLRVSTALCCKGFASAENSVVQCWRTAMKQTMERERVICEYETMLNSSPGKGIIDTGCAKMMRWDQTLSSNILIC